MSTARIYKPAKNAMQSGTAKTKKWRLEFESDDPRFIEHVMGWTGNRDTDRQLRMCFNSAEEAIEFAEKNNIKYRVSQPHSRRQVLKAYADNFAFNRVEAYGAQYGKNTAS